MKMRETSRGIDKKLYVNNKPIVTSWKGCNMVEEWRILEGISNHYEVSNLGNVRSLDRITKGHKYKGKLLKQQETFGGYLYITIRGGEFDGKKYKVHRLVAMYFIPNPDNKPQVDHIDGNPKNNKVDNLRWTTPTENSNNTTTKDNQCRSLRGIYKKSVSMYTKEGSHVRDFDSITEAANYVGGCFQNISQCLHNKRDYYKGYIWKFKE